MKFYHGTTKEKWELIQEEGVLFGKSSIWTESNGENGYRHTYLTPELEVAQQHIAKEKDGIILEVEYEPVGPGHEKDNYGFDPPTGQVCWQFSVFEPIDLSKVRVYEMY